VGYALDRTRADRLIRDLQQDYRIFAPIRLANRGWLPDTDLVRYGEINSIAEIVLDRPSDYSAKDVLFPAVQTTQYFTKDSVRASAADDKGILLFARPCDINGIRRLDTIFLENGGQADHYYQRQRARLKVVLLECRTGWDNCFCVSMGSHRTDDYALAFRIEGDSLLVAVKDDEFAPFFQDLPAVAFTPEFVQANAKTVQLPDISGSEALKKACALDLWQQYNDTCVSCGSCNTVCVTCSCFDTKDIIYHETSRDGERRRTWSSCMLEDFATMAGGHGVRKTAGERMRFKTLHKVQDFKARFGKEHMCVGCGRCDTRCPEKISFAETINKLSTAMAGGEVSG
jgi:anaerobic sulfite reductase subunit A